MKRMLWLVTALLFLGSGWFLVTNSRAATETAPYTVVEAEDAFEIRDYEALHLAKVSMPGDSMNGGFMKLFRFIDGANERSEKIAMTTPVIVQRSAGGSSMSFVMPKASVAQGLPAPKGEVKLDQLAAVRVAAVRFSGRSSESKEQEQLARLRTWAQAKGLELEGEPLLAYYDPPWTPGFLRRNEVLLRLKKK